MIDAPGRPKSLPDACVAQALAIIEQVGLEGLSLREVARRLGVSHQAPYKHFASRDHLLAEVVGRAFTAFAAHLDARPRSPDAAEDLAAMGRAYLGYALRHPLQYRLMFGTALPDPDAHPAMMRNARHTFALLQDAIGSLARQHSGDAAISSVDRDALFVWSAMHGLAGILQSGALTTLSISPTVLAAIPAHALERIGAALRTPLLDRALEPSQVDHDDARGAARD